MRSFPRLLMQTTLRFSVLTLLVPLLAGEARSDTLFTNLNPGTDIGTVYGYTVAAALTTGGDAVSVDQIIIPQRGLGGGPDGSTQPPNTVPFDPAETLTVYSNSNSGGGTIGSPVSSSFGLSGGYNPYPQLDFQTAGLVLQANTTYWFVLATPSTTIQMGWDFSTSGNTPTSPTGITFPTGGANGTFFNDTDNTLTNGSYSQANIVDPTLATTPLLLELDGAVPEPLTIVSALTAVTVGLAVSWNRRRKRATSAIPA